MKTGRKRLLKNETGLHVHVRITNNVNTIKNHINTIKNQNKHKDNVKFGLWINEQCVKDIVSMIHEWKYNSFDH